MLLMHIFMEWNNFILFFECSDFDFNIRNIWIDSIQIEQAKPRISNQMNAHKNRKYKNRKTCGIWTNMTVECHGNQNKNGKK